MKNDESEVVATSTDLSDVKQTILIVSDDKYLVINQNKRVSEYIVYFAKIENILSVLLFCSGIYGYLTFLDKMVKLCTF